MPRKRKAKVGKVHHTCIDGVDEWWLWIDGECQHPPYYSKRAALTARTQARKALGIKESP